MFELTPFDYNQLFSLNPFEEIEKLQKNLLNNFSLMDFKTDIKNNGSEYILEAELPGFDKDEILIDINDNYLTIKAQRKTEKKESKENYFIRCERSFGALSRTFNISNVKSEEITAEYKNGILKLTLPKKNSKLPPSRRLEIK